MTASKKTYTKTESPFKRSQHNVIMKGKKMKHKAGGETE